MEEPVILKSIDEQMEEEERARNGTVKQANGPSPRLGTNPETLSTKSTPLLFKEDEEEKSSPQIFEGNSPDFRQSDVQFSEPSVLPEGM